MLLPQKKSDLSPMDKTRIFGEVHSFLVTDVIRILQNHISPDRLARMKQVIQQRRSDLTVVMENIHNRGNTNAVMRTMEAFGYFRMDSIHLSEDFKDSNRVSQGADKWILDHSWTSTEKCIHHLKDQGFQILVTSLEGGRPIYEIPGDRPMALCFGNEKEGATPALLQMADERVFVPMRGFVQSFNISVAAALCLQTLRLKQDAIGPGPLNSEWEQYLEALYFFRGCQNSESLLLEQLRRERS